MGQSRQGNGTAVLSVALTVEFDLADISMTMNTYAHFLDAEDIAVAEAMDSILKPKKADVD